MRTDLCNEESALCSCYKNQDMEYRLLEEHLPLIKALAYRIRCGYLNHEALVQAGSIGFVKAIRHYHPDRNAKLTTYAVPWILGEMKKAMRTEITPRMELSFDEISNADGIVLDQYDEGNDTNIQHIDLRAAIKQLDKELQLLICLRYFRDKTQKETAILLKKSQTQISRMERRALDMLRISLD